MADPDETLSDRFIAAPSAELGSRKVHAYYTGLIKGLSNRVDNYCSAIQGFGSLALMAEDLDPELRLNIERMKHAGEETSLMMARVLSLIGTSKATNQEVHPNVFFPTLERGIRHIGDGYGVTIATAIAPDMPSINADPTRVWECVVELLRNACEAAATGGGSVAFDVAHPHNVIERPADEVHVIIKNSQSELGPEKITAAFEPFSSSKAGDGDHFGLGLPVAEMLAESMGASIDISSSGGTTKARLHLPTMTTTTAPL